MKSHTSTSTLKVFVYGTLKPGKVNYYRYCDRQTQLETPAFSQGVLYDLPLGYPAMTKGEGIVKGFLLTFSNFNVLDSLDRLEGYQAQRKSSLNEYYRLLVPVYNLENELIDKAWTYFMTLEKVKQYQGTIITSGYWT